jgi:parallel beta-helix repeat protein
MKLGTFISALVALCLVAGTSFGATYYVATTGSDATGTGTQANPFATIQKGVDTAATGDVVEVEPGTYVENIGIENKRITLMSSEPYDAAVVAATVIDANRNGLPAIAFLGAGCNGAVLTGFTITNAESLIGGVAIANCSPVITRNVITGNASTWAEQYTGGGGILCVAGSPEISWNTISNNTADQMGGGIACIGSKRVTISNCTFEGNSAGWGGGGVSFLVSNGSISDCTFDSNSTVNWEGGAILAQWGSHVDISDCTIADNSADGGGGISFIEELAGAPSGTVRNCIISGNFTHLPGIGGGGGIHCMETRRVKIINCLIAGNTANDGGGGILADGSGQLLVSNCTIVQNSNDTDPGGGVMVEWGHRAVLQNNIIWDNSCALGAQVGVSNCSTAFLYNDIEGGRPGFYVDNAKIAWQKGNIDSDPLFADLGTDGDGDYHLKSLVGRWDPAADGGDGAWVADDVHSPCIDAGNKATKYALEPAPNGKRVNMGVYGGTAEASKSATYYTLVSAPAGRGTTSPEPGARYACLSGESKAIEAVPGAGSVFKKWVARPAASAVFDDPYDASTNVTINGDVMIMAQFKAAP